MKNILQFGEGNFLRAFVGLYIQNANDCGDNISVAVTQPRTNTTIINNLKKQNCKYNVLVRGRYNGNLVNEKVNIECVERAIDSNKEYQLLVDLFESESLEIVISNTTEAGICFLPDNFETFPAKVTKLLYKRYLSIKKPIVFLPVELIENNGSQLKNCIINYSKLFGYENDFFEFIDSCSFCNTLVDRIVTGHIDGDDDICSVACEPYSSWIIEADDKAKSLMSFAKYNDSIVFCDNLDVYRERKVKILNGTHTMSVLAAYMCGISIVRDMMNDPVFDKYISLGLEEIKSTINLPIDELERFCSSVKERFCNPFIDHKLIDISLNSASKFRTRCLPTIADYYNNKNSIPKILTFSFAVLIYFYKYCNDVRDSEEVKEMFSKDILCILSDDFWGMDLSFLVDRVTEYFDLIESKGIKPAIKEVVYE